MFFQLFYKNCPIISGHQPVRQKKDTLLAGFLQQIGLKIIKNPGEHTSCFYMLVLQWYNNSYNKVDLFLFFLC